MGRSVLLIFVEFLCCRAFVRLVHRYFENVWKMAPLRWTDEQIDHLKQLRADNLSAREMGARLGCSRNAVIGKLRRLGLSAISCVPTAQRKRQPKPKVERRGRFRSTVVDRLAHTATIPFRDLPPDQSDCTVRLIDTNDMPESPNKCRYPLGEPTWDMEVCGARTVAGCSWCQRHFKIMRNQRAAA